MLFPMSSTNSVFFPGVQSCGREQLPLFQEAAVAFWATQDVFLALAVLREVFGLGLRIVCLQMYLLKILWRQPIGSLTCTSGLAKGTCPDLSSPINFKLHHSQPAALGSRSPG